MSGGRACQPSSAGKATRGPAQNRPPRGRPAPTSHPCVPAALRYRFQSFRFQPRQTHGWGGGESWRLLHNLGVVWSTWSVGWSATAACSCKDGSEARREGEENQRTPGKKGARHPQSRAATAGPIAGGTLSFTGSGAETRERAAACIERPPELLGRPPRAGGSGVRTRANHPDFLLRLSRYGANQASEVLMLKKKIAIRTVSSEPGYCSVGAEISHFRAAAVNSIFGYR